MDVPLNTDFLRRRVLELGLEQWWIAERLDVDRRTVSRWLNGSVDRIRPANFRALAELLTCDPLSLERNEGAAALATSEDQREAALLIARSRILETLGPGHQFDLAEKILKASLVPQLPKLTLGNLLNQLSIACWRQSKLEMSLEYAQRALAIAKALNDEGLRLRATMNMAHHAYWSGDLKGTIDRYEGCARRAGLMQNALQRAANLSNLGAVYFEYGDLVRSRSCQDEAIAIYGRLDMPMSLAIAHAHLLELALETGELALAEEQLSACRHQSNRVSYRRGEANCMLFSAQLAAHEHRPDEARRLVEAGLEKFRALNVHESGNHRWAGRALRIAGSYRGAEDALRKAKALASTFPVASAFVDLERYLLARDMGAPQGERDRCLDQAITSLASIGAEARAAVLRSTQMSPDVP